MGVGAEVARSEDDEVEGEVGVTWKRGDYELSSQCLLLYW